MSAVADAVRTIIVEQLGVSHDQLARAARFTEDLGADSLDLVELVMAGEEVFDLEIPDEEAEKILTIGEAIDYVETALIKAGRGPRTRSES